MAEASGLAIPSDPAETLRDPLETLAERAGARVRRVRLTGAWWTRDCGPLIGYRVADEEPVAILPPPRSRFGRRRPRLVTRSGAAAAITAGTAVSLAPTAHMFHPPLPRPATPSSVLRFALTSTIHECPTVLLTALGAMLLALATPQAALAILDYAVPLGDRVMLTEIAFAMIAAAAGAALFDVAQGVAILRIVSSSTARLQTGLWDHVLRQPAAFFRRFTSGDLRSRADAITQARLLLNETAIAGLVGSLVSLLMVALLLYYSVPLAIAAVLIAATAAIAAAGFGYLSWRPLQSMQELDGRLGGLMVQILAGISKLQVAAAERRAFDKWNGLYEQRTGVAQQVQANADRLRLFTIVLWPVSIALFFWLISGDASAISAGRFVAFTTAFGLFLSAAIGLGESAVTILSVTNLWKRMTPILDANPENAGSKVNPGRLSGELRVDRVSFRYRAHGPLTLDDVSLHAAPGECIAIVGPSGSGKSTIVNLLLRFETPLSGGVYYDGQDLDGLDVVAVRRQLGVVTQDNRVLAGSIYDNIVCGSLLPMDAAWEAARGAGLDEDIRQMPMGMHTLVSEAGGNLSGGQRQRLLIARALVQKPRIVMLDEATSALDNRTQAIVTETLNAMKVTRILVAHRLSTIRQADRIYVVEAGRIVQTGVFDDLMKEEGLFARLMRRQTPRS